MNTRTQLWLLLSLISAGCPSSPTKDALDTPDVDADADTDADSDTDADADSDTDLPCLEVELCDGFDNDCDGELGPHEVDADQDGVLDCLQCDQAGFYGPTIGLSGQALVDALNGLTNAQQCNDYSVAREFMYATLDNDGTGRVRCVYTGREKTGISGIPSDTVLNTEHTWPQSQGAGSTPARCDLHHLYPTEPQANSYRSNHPFGVVQSQTSTGGYNLGDSKLGTQSGGGTVFEPPDWHKGNIARTMFYFAMRYPAADRSSQYTPAKVALFKQWHALDPVDQAELDRTLGIEAEQGAANPFVVCPFLVDEL